MTVARKKVRTYLCEAVYDPHAAPNAAAQDVGHEEVDAAALHAAPLAHAHGAQRDNEDNGHGHEHRQDGQAYPSIPL